MKKVAVAFFISFLMYHTCYAAEAVPIVHSTVYESSHIITTNQNKSLYYITVTWNNEAMDRWLIIYDSTTVPADGALDTTKILYCASVSLSSDPTIGTRSFDWTQHPLYRGTSGLVAIISVDSDGCITKTADGNNDWITAGFN